MPTDEPAPAADPRAQLLEELQAARLAALRTIRRRLDDNGSLADATAALRTLVDVGPLLG